VPRMVGVLAGRFFHREVAGEWRAVGGENRVAVGAGSAVAVDVVGKMFAADLDADAVGERVSSISGSAAGSAATRPSDSKARAGVEFHIEIDGRMGSMMQLHLYFVVQPAWRGGTGFAEARGDDKPGPLFAARLRGGPPLSPMAARAAEAAKPLYALCGAYAPEMAALEAGVRRRSGRRVGSARSRTGWRPAGQGRHEGRYNLPHRREVRPTQPISFSSRSITFRSRTRIFRRRGGRHRSGPRGRGRGYSAGLGQSAGAARRITPETARVAMCAPTTSRLVMRILG